MGGLFAIQCLAESHKVIHLLFGQSLRFRVMPLPLTQVKIFLLLS
jgi:hypothetical protein